MLEIKDEICTKLTAIHLFKNNLKSQAIIPEKIQIKIKKKSLTKNKIT